MPLLCAKAISTVAPDLVDDQCLECKWFHAMKFCALLYLLVACIEAPFSAVVFTVHYARGMSAAFPTLLTTRTFLITAGSGLLHIALEVWMLAPSIKEGRFKAKVKGLFTKIVQLEDEPTASATDQGAGKNGGSRSDAHVTVMVLKASGSRELPISSAVQLLKK